ncbi:pyridoxamine kinase [Lactococcus formosensis]|uniref:pyridoxal kinase n=1 Tax=Lactococcus formosensis TaxID=1281486 RepID=A0A9Q8Y291_9LACT|nr:pyridoxamine kinase [Lactococcus formosensis]NHI66771.1 pyridoxamine kinase [Lactococcus garvieae]MCH1722868.1 pyridoxamine kinase [Lactococcus formosensis]MCO7179705.1 pyridoxamine kinase [Lactococcus formosensis]MDG6112982.1 pyridoxamine kinase [Lactococcus formosensis]MDG6115008.1 pyridoxamine kinase [Lactococcus formosensis]
MTKNIVAVHDISCVGRCSLTVALPIISAYGIECRLLPTALLSTHTGGFTNFTYLDLTDEMRNIIQAWQELNLQMDGIYSGFMASAEQIDVLKGLIDIYKDENNLTIIDPVMADHGELYSVFDMHFVEKMGELLPYADVLLPNITEACLLTGTPYQEGVQTEGFIEMLIEKLQARGAKNIVLTGVMLDEKYIGAAAARSTGQIDYVLAEKLPGAYHGTGDIFGSVLSAELTNGKTLTAATREAVDFVVKSIKNTPKSADKRYGVEFEQTLKSKRKQDQ